MKPIKSYIIQAVYDWALDNGLTPQILVDTDTTGVQVPAQYVENRRVVLNIHPQALQNLVLGDESIVFRARFSGQGTDVEIPLSAILAIYARENGQGIVFSADEAHTPRDKEPNPQDGSTDSPSVITKPVLKIIK